MSSQGEGLVSCYSIESFRSLTHDVELFETEHSDSVVYCETECIGGKEIDCSSEG